MAERGFAGVPSLRGAVVTCHASDGKPAPVLVDVVINGSATGVTNWKQLTEHLIRARVAGPRATTYCAAHA